MYVQYTKTLEQYTATKSDAQLRVPWYALRHAGTPQKPPVKWH